MRCELQKNEEGRAHFGAAFLYSHCLHRNVLRTIGFFGSKKGQTQANPRFGALAPIWSLSDTTELEFPPLRLVETTAYPCHERWNVETDSKSQSFLARNEFLIRRLHSLSGLIPVGAYMCVHLTTNSSILMSSQKFQQLVYQIHALGPALPFVEWTFIFLPLIFHAVVGVVIIKGGLTNSNYSHSGNYRYMLQRATGMIAFIFIFGHVFHMHGWFHADWWMETVAKPLGGAQFKPYNAPSTAAAALSNPIMVILYAVGILSCVFHLANGLWTMGITWGLWVSPAAQKRANYLSIAFGIGLTFISMGALLGFGGMSDSAKAEAREVEERMFQEKVASGEVSADSHKHIHANEAGHGTETAPIPGFVWDPDASDGQGSWVNPNAGYADGAAGVEDEDDEATDAGH